MRNSKRKRTAAARKVGTRSAKTARTPEKKRSGGRGSKVKGEKTSKKGVIKSEPATSRPNAEECRYAASSLATLHPHVVERNNERRATLLESCGMRDSVTDAIVSTMLSQNTTDKNSKEAFASLKKAFPSWAAVADCEDIGIIENAIRVAGLAKTRAERIRTLLRTVRDERGESSLDYLKSMSDDDVKEELSRFKGLGPKTISCVLLFALGRPEFPVDTHVLRIAQRMGWVPTSATRESAYEHLNATVPSEVKLDLHCLLVFHGKVCHRCAANGRPQFPPADGSKLDCPLGKPVMLSQQKSTMKNEPIPDSDKSGMNGKTAFPVKKEPIPDAVESCIIKEEAVFLDNLKEDLAVKTEDVGS